MKKKFTTFKEIKLKEGFKSSTKFCRDEQGMIIRDRISIELRQW
jgi:hypothetical protein